MQPELISGNDAPAKTSCDALVVGAFSDNGDFRLAPGTDGLEEVLKDHLLEYLKTSGFKAKAGEVVVVPTLGKIAPSALAVVGLGGRKKARGADLRRAAGAAARKLSERSVLASTLHSALDSDDGAAATSQGFLLGSYRFTTYKSDPHPSKIQRVLLLGAATDSIEKGRVTAEAALLARDLTNEPPATITPVALAERAQEIADVAGLECEIYDEKQLEAKGFGGILGVAAGSARPPRLISLRYSPEGAKGKVALVGKGVTFDSGGLSLKDAKNMETMKTDMAGAAAVLAAVSKLPQLGPKVEVRALIPTTENMPGDNAIKPGDVIKHYGGRTTEVLNTDAEGRLILADALALASEDKPDAIIDVATLTGSIMIALGRKSTGLFSNNDALADQILAAAEAAGERLWRMPLYDDYFSDIESEIADSKNTGSRYGGSITAALFLQAFVKEGIPWAHLDIAGAARAESDTDEGPKGGTGVAARTLIEWVERRGG